MKYLILVAFLFTVPACASHVPPNLTPEARVAYVNAKVIKPLDLVRDVSQDCSQIVGCGVSTAAAVTISQWHMSALTIIDKAITGWQGVVSESLNEVFKNLTTTEQRALAPYFSLMKTVIGELR